jgi:hypothetical protein
MDISSSFCKIQVRFLNIDISRLFCSLSKPCSSFIWISDLSKAYGPGLGHQFPLRSTSAFGSNITTTSCLQSANLSSVQWSQGIRSRFSLGNSHYWSLLKWKLEISGPYHSVHNSPGECILSWTVRYFILPAGWIMPALFREKAGTKLKIQSLSNLLKTFPWFEIVRW